MIVRIAGTLTLLLGFAIWADLLPVIVPIHMLLGLVLVIGLASAAVAGRRAGIGNGLAVTAIAWVVLTLVFGLNQQTILPGEGHVVVEVAHLVVGLVAIALGEMIGARAARGGSAAS